MSGSNTPDPRRNWMSDGVRRAIDPGWLRAAANQVVSAVKHAWTTPPVEAQAAAITPVDPALTDDRGPMGTPQHTGTAIASLENRGHEPWMQPGQPMRPIPPFPQDAAGRAFDYPYATNLSIRPRQTEGVSFENLKALSVNLDMVRLAIETRKDQMASLTWSCAKRKPPHEQTREKPDERCAQIEDFLRRPDRRLPWISWVRQLLEQQMVLDAPSIYVRRTMGGEIYSLEIVDGAQIVPRLDLTGRMPLPPDVAYQQILKGSPAVNYTADELIYWPRNPRADHVYGMSPVEQIIMTVNIAIRREVAKLAYFTEGNVPEALISVPKNWTPDMITQFQTMWDAMMTDQNARRKAKFVPGEMNFMQTRSEQMLGDATDEWLARVVCYAFSLPPLPFVKMMNRATAESAYDAAIEEGLSPMITWLKSLLDHIIQNVFGYSDLEMVPDDIRKVDPAEQESRNLQLIQRGIKSLDEVRIEMGLEPLGMPHAIFGIGPLGLMFVEDILKARAQGLMMPQPAPPPDMLGGGGFPPGGGAQPALAGPSGGNGGPVHPQAQDLLNGINPRVLDAVGLGAQGPAGRTVDVTTDEAHASDPLSNVVAHPMVLKTLREVERMQGRG